MHYSFSVFTSDPHDTGVQMIEEKLDAITGGRWVLTDNGTEANDGVWEPTDIASFWKEGDNSPVPTCTYGISVMVSPVGETYSGKILAWELSVSIDIAIEDHVKKEEPQPAIVVVHDGT